MRKSLWSAVGLAALVTACGGEEDWKETPVSAGDLPFSYSGDHIESASEFQRSRNSRSGTTIQSAFLPSADGFAYIRHYRAGHGSFFDMQDPDRWLQDLKADGSDPGVVSEASLRSHGQSVVTEILEPEDGLGCARFAMPQEPVIGIDNSGVSPYDVIVSGMYCREGEVVSESEVMDFLAEIKI